MIGDAIAHSRITVKLDEGVMASPWSIEGRHAVKATHRTVW